MITPTVTEIPRTMSSVGRDTFMFGAEAAMPSSEAAPWPAKRRSLAPAQPHIAVLAAQREAMSAHATTFAHAA